MQAPHAPGGCSVLRRFAHCMMLHSSSEVDTVFASYAAAELIDLMGILRRLTVVSPEIVSSLIWSSNGSSLPKVAMVQWRCLTEVCKLKQRKVQQRPAKVPHLSGTPAPSVFGMSVTDPSVIKVTIGCQNTRSRSTFHWSHTSMKPKKCIIVDLMRAPIQTRCLSKFRDPLAFCFRWQLVQTEATFNQCIRTQRLRTSHQIL